MTLLKLIEKKTLIVLGLNSGTSADGLDMAVLRISRLGRNIDIRFMAGRKKLYPPEIKKTLLAFSGAEGVSLDELVYLNNRLGHYMGEQALSFIRHIETRKTKVDLIASHGQTIRHLPLPVKYLGKSVHGSYQIGSPDYIAAMTGGTVVADFRQAEIALGGEGAPITVEAMKRLFGGQAHPQLIVNIGGMANYFYFPAEPNGKSEAADCGPGNSLLDLLASRLFGIPFDKNGRLAERGKISERLLTLLSGGEFFRSRLRSTGREVFGDTMAKAIVESGRKLGLSSEDLLATVTKLTAWSIAAKIRPILKKDDRIEKLYLTGGGRKNIFLRKRLGDYVPELSVEPIDRLGINGDYIEAASYAVLGEACLRTESLGSGYNLKKHGEKLMPVSGKITQPPAVSEIR